MISTSRQLHFALILSALMIASGALAQEQASDNGCAESQSPDAKPEAKPETGSPKSDSSENEKAPFSPKVRRPSDRIGTTAPDPQAEPDACSTCSTGLVALGITASAPLTLVGALGILAADKAGWIENDPMAGFGIPLWGAGLGCAGVHVFFAVISAVAFSRDFKKLISSDDDDSDEIEAKSKPKKSKPDENKSKQPGLAIDAAYVQSLPY